jgi:glycosyltransferase involved in cell wall biosynthesis
VVGRCTFAVPGDLSTPTGGYAYDRRMIAELGDLGWQIDLLDLGEGFPWPDETTRAAAQAQLLAMPAGRIVVVDGLALGVLPEVASQLAPRNPLLALVHHPLALEWGVSVEQAAALLASERAALATVRGVIVTSTSTARLVAADYAVPAERITVARPGSDPVPLERFQAKWRPVRVKKTRQIKNPEPRFDSIETEKALAQGSRDGVVQFLSVGAIVPRKGFDVLIAALATLSDLPWRLTIAGDRTRDRDAAAGLDADIARHALGNRIAVSGAVSPQHLAALYAEADVFVLASRFEGYGMAYAEAIAHGLPVIGTNAGAIPETVPPDAGLLVAPGDVTALAQALRRVIGDSALRSRLAAAARAAAPQLPAWRHSAEIFARVLEKLA